jgi:hypothetical protein
MWKKQMQPMNEEAFLNLCKTNFSAALKYNTLWRGDLIPHLPVTKNIFCLNESNYDLEKLNADLDSVVKNTQSGWEDKANDSTKKDIWKSITLKGYQGKLQPFLEQHDIKDHSINPYQYTDNMHFCNYIREILESLESQGSDIYLVRLLSLVPGKFVGFHTDNCVFKDRKNIIRCHIPIITDPKCKMFIGYPIKYNNTETGGFYSANPFWNCHLEPGKLWYTNVNCLHAVENKSDIVRVHLVIDLKPTEEMLAKIYGKTN